MKINNPTNWETATNYIKRYAKQIEALFPELSNVELDITTMDSLQKDGTNPLLYEERSLTDNKPRIYYDEDVVKTITDEQQLFALISHEIGHMLAHYKQEKREGVEGEIAADNYVIKLGLGKELLNALILLKDNYNNNRDTNFDFLPNMSESYSKTNEQLNNRIEIIKKLLSVEL